MSDLEISDTTPDNVEYNILKICSTRSGVTFRESEYSKGKYFLDLRIRNGQLQFPQTFDPADANDLASMCADRISGINAKSDNITQEFPFRITDAQLQAYSRTTVPEIYRLYFSAERTVAIAEQVVTERSGSVLYMSTGLEHDAAAIELSRGESGTVKMYLAVQREYEKLVQQAESLKRGVAEKQSLNSEKMEKLERTAESGSFDLNTLRNYARIQGKGDSLDQIAAPAMNMSPPPYQQGVMNGSESAEQLLELYKQAVQCIPAYLDFFGNISGKLDILSKSLDDVLDFQSNMEDQAKENPLFRDYVSLTLRKCTLEAQVSIYAGTIDALNNENNALSEKNLGLKKSYKHLLECVVSLGNTFCNVYKFFTGPKVQTIRPFLRKLRVEMKPEDYDNAKETLDLSIKGLTGALTEICEDRGFVSVVRDEQSKESGVLIPSHLEADVRDMWKRVKHLTRYKLRSDQNSQSI